MCTEKDSEDSGLVKMKEFKNSQGMEATWKGDGLFL